MNCIHRLHKSLLATALLTATCLLASAQTAADMADQEIEQLLNHVGTSGCDFHRNGSRHPPAEAADHLRLKYRRGKRYADTAEHFIDRLASKSSWSGEPYQVECAGEAPQDAGPWLHRALGDIRGQQTP